MNSCNLLTLHSVSKLNFIVFVKFVFFSGKLINNFSFS